MAGWWEGLKGKTQTKKDSSDDYWTDELVVGRYVRRVKEIVDEAGEIGKLLEGLPVRIGPRGSERETKGAIGAALLAFAGAGQEGMDEELMKHIAPEVGRTILAGFCGYKLAEEALALLSLVVVKIACLRRIYEESGNSAKLQWLTGLQDLMNEAGPMFEQTLVEMAPFRTLDAGQIIESLGQRIIVAREQVDK